MSQPPWGNLGRLKPLAHKGINPMEGYGMPDEMITDSARWTPVTTNADWVFVRMPQYIHLDHGINPSVVGWGGQKPEALRAAVEKLEWLAMWASEEAVRLRTIAEALSDDAKG